MPKACGGLTRGADAPIVKVKMKVKQIPRQHNKGDVLEFDMMRSRWIDECCTQTLRPPAIANV